MWEFMCTSLCLMWFQETKVPIIGCFLRLLVCQSPPSLCDHSLCILHAWAPPNSHHTYTKPYIQFRLRSVSPYVPYKILGEMIDASTSQCCSSVWVFSLLYHPSPLQYQFIKYLSPHSHTICLQCSFQLTLSLWSKEKQEGLWLKHNRTWSSAGNAVIKK